MWLHRSSRFASALRIVCALAVLAASSGHGHAAPTEQRLYLEASINGHPTGFVVEVRQRAGGALYMRASELRAIGLRPPGDASADGLVALAELRDLQARYDERNQSIHFSTSDAARLPRVIDARPPLRGSLSAGSARAVPGAVVNYLVFGSTDAPLSQWNGFQDRRSGVSAALDARAFSEFGVLSQSGILHAGDHADAVRLDTTWSLSDPQSLVTHRAGDVIAGGLSWTRPIRMGGVQSQRAFGLRPDLITVPTPSLRGSAALPSTVDVYLDNVKALSQPVQPGPFEITNLPVIAGVSSQRLVVRDSLGRQIVTTQPFYASARLLRTGLTDYSVETGFRRLSYGFLSGDYDDSPVASASTRHGVSDWLTLESHGEAGADLLNAGAGAVFPVWHTGVASLALAGSRSSDDSGAQLAGSVEFEWRRMTLFARGQGSFGNYRDLAAQPADRSAGLFASAYAPPRELYQTGFSMPLPSRSALNLNYAHLKRDGEVANDILGATLTQTLGSVTTLFVTGFHDLSGARNTGLYAGLSTTFGDGLTANAGVSRAAGATGAGFDVGRTQTDQPGSYGWRVRDREGDVSDRSAAVSYRAQAGRVAVAAQQFGARGRASAEFEGAVALADGGVFFANRIDDAFAIVNAGAPGVPVFYENRPAGITDDRGRALVPRLRAYEPNRLAIDPTELPMQARIERTRIDTIATDRGAVVANFGVSPAVVSRLITLRRPSGSFVAAGERGIADPSGAAFVVGYEGQAYLTDPAETLRVQGTEPCRAQVTANATAICR